jgi:hypothetical protein
LLGALAVLIGLASFYLSDWNEEPIAPRLVSIGLWGLAAAILTFAIEPLRRSRQEETPAQASAVLPIRTVAVVGASAAVGVLVALPYIDFLREHRRLVLLVCTIVILGLIAVSNLVETRLRAASGRS